MEDLFDRIYLDYYLIVDIVKLKLICVPSCGPLDRLAHVVDLVCMPVVSLCPCGSETLAIFILYGDEIPNAAGMIWVYGMMP